MKTVMIKSNPSPRQLPSSIYDAGNRADVVFDEDLLFPSKEMDGTLRLPWRPQMQFAPLRDNTQFAIHYDGERESSRFDPIRGVSIFAGMDESSFVTCIDSVAMGVLRHSGEAEFFDELRPGHIKLIERIHGDNGHSTQRHGDIWFHMTGMSWKDFLQEQESRGKYATSTHNSSGLIHQNGTEDIFPGVRHRITGQRYDGTEVNLHGHRLEKVVVAEGIISAPDHKNRRTGVGPYLFARTPHLVPPPQVAVPPRVRHNDWRGLTARSFGGITSMSELEAFIRSHNLD